MTHGDILRDNSEKYVQERYSTYQSTTKKLTCAKLCSAIVCFHP